MKVVCQVIGLLLLPILALAVLGVAAFIALGALLARWLPLSLFQASALAIAATAAVALVIQALMTMMHLQIDLGDEEDDFDWEPIEENDTPRTPAIASLPKVGRNDPCPCGSGKKFKYCCGKSSST